MLLLNATSHAQASSLTNTVTIPATTAGSVLVVIVCGDTGLTSSTDDAGHTGTWVTGPQDGAHDPMTMFVGTGVSAGTTSIVVTWSVIQNTGVWVLEFSGQAASPLGSSSGNNGSSTDVAGGPVTPVQTENVVVIGAAANLGASAGPSGGFTSIGSLTWTGSRVLLAGYITQHNTSAASSGWTLSGSTGWDSVIAVIEGAAVGGGSTGDGSNFIVTDFGGSSHRAPWLLPTSRMGRKNSPGDSYGTPTFITLPNVFAFAAAAGFSFTAQQPPATVSPAASAASLIFAGLGATTTKGTVANAGLASFSISGNDATGQPVETPLPGIPDGNEFDERLFEFFWEGPWAHRWPTALRRKW